MAGRIPKVDEGGHLPDEVVAAISEDIGFAVAQHGEDASFARPDVTAVYWIGTVEPTNMTEADLYNGPAA